MNINLKDEESLQHYFEHTMSGGEEQNFLIDVASRDDMRLAFRSQLELLKVVGKDLVAMPGAAFVRERTLAALGLSAMLLAPQEEAKAAAGFVSRTFDVIRKPMVSLSLGLLIGGAGVYGVMPGAKVEQNVAAPMKQVGSSGSQPEQQGLQAGEPALPMREATAGGVTTERAASKRVVSTKANTLQAVKTNANSTPEHLPIVGTEKPIDVTIESKFSKPSDTNSK